MTRSPAGFEPNVTGDDVVLRFRTGQTGVSGRLVRLGPSVDTILSRHNAPVSVSEVLGEALTLVALLGPTLKFDGKLILQTKTDGPLDFLVVDYQTPGKLRGYVRYAKSAVASLETGSAGRPDQGVLLGSGYLAMTIDQGVETDRYQGIVGLDSVPLSKAAEQYFEQSEQLPTFLRLAVARSYHAGEKGEPGQWSWRAGGMLLQYISPIGGYDRPIAATDEDEQHLDGEFDDGWTRAKLLAGTLEDHELLDPMLTPERLLHRLFHEEGVAVQDTLPVSEYCRCSRERVHEFLKSFGAAQMNDMRTEDGSVTVTCEFCNSAYRFEPSEFEP